VPAGSLVCEHGYALSGRGMHPDGRPCLPEGTTESGEATHLIQAILSSPTSVIASAPALDAHALAAHLLRLGYRFVDPAEKHVIEVRKTSQTIKHPLACRAGDLFDCPVAAAAERLNGPPGAPGRYECTVEAGHFVLLDRVTE
jgi:hypothetical protein